MNQIIGIDLGTTNSLCAIFEHGVPRLIPNAHGDRMTPSVVGVLDDGRLIVGSAARELRVTNPQQTVSCFKRWMGTDRTVKIGKSTFNAIELSSFVLRSLKDDAEAELGHAVSRAVITVPAYFNDMQRKATKQAGELAGLQVLRIINEPTAAALTYGFHDRQAEKHLIVIDLGGGTFDVTVMEVFEGTLEIISTAGESQLGGEDFTDRLVALAFRQEGLQLETAELKQPLRAARLREECERAKQALFKEDSYRIRVPDSKGEFLESSKAFKLTHKTFAGAVDSLLERLRKPIDRALRDAQRTPEEIDDVILVGGATRMTVLRDFVKDYFEKDPQLEFNPDEVVALGASVQAALINDDKAVDDMVMTDVCPFTLGVEIVKEFGGQIVPGYYQPIIHRNTTIPVSREEVFYTIGANQREVEVRVFQGESRKVDDNLDLGQLVVDGIPPGPAGQPVHVRFTYDLNGILEVEAMIPATGRKFNAVLTQHAQGMSDDEIRQAVSRMQQLKFYPRDDLQNQRLVLFCERMVGEVSQFHREQLEQAIDVFEQAMSTGDREIFEHAKNGLLMILSQLGIAYEDSGESNEKPLDE